MVAAGPGILEAKGFERPDFTTFTFPAANLADAATEEIEIDQALSLQGRRGRDYLGFYLSGLNDEFIAEHLTVGASDHDMSTIIALNTRTGAFQMSDPEQLDIYTTFAASAAGGTDTAKQAMVLHDSARRAAEPMLYVAPRLFWRFTNNIDAQINADGVAARMGSVSVRLNFRLFIELLERFADVTLL